MNEPTYKPKTWVLFTSEENTAGFGCIVGGFLNSQGEWSYTVKGTQLDGSLHSVHEADITHTLQNGSWIAPTTFGGSGSAYTAGA